MMKVRLTEIHVNQWTVLRRISSKYYNNNLPVHVTLLTWWVQGLQQKKTQKTMLMVGTV